MCWKKFSLADLSQIGGSSTLKQRKTKIMTEGALKNVQKKRKKKSEIISLSLSLNSYMLFCFVFAFIFCLGLFAQGLVVKKVLY